MDAILDHADGPLKIGLEGVKRSMETVYYYSCTICNDQFQDRDEALMHCTGPDHAAYIKIGNELGRLLVAKNKAYGSSFSKTGSIMQLLYPGGIDSKQMEDALCVVRVLDKLFRIATNRDALGESPWRDIAGYAILAVARVEDFKK